LGKKIPVTGAAAVYARTARLIVHLGEVAAAEALPTSFVPSSFSLGTIWEGGDSKWRACVHAANKHQQEGLPRSARARGADGRRHPCPPLRGSLLRAGGKRRPLCQPARALRPRTNGRRPRRLHR